MRYLLRTCRRADVRTQARFPRPHDYTFTRLHVHTPHGPRMINETTTGRKKREADLILIAALCPSIAASDTVVSALSLGIATTLVGLISASILMLMKRWLDEDTQLVAILLVTASVVAIVEVAMRAWFHVAHEIVGVFLPLIVANLALVHTLRAPRPSWRKTLASVASLTLAVARSEERRVGKEGRSRWPPDGDEKQRRRWVRRG